MKIRVFPGGIVFITIYILVSLVALGLVIFTPSTKKLWLWILSTIMFIVLPVIFLIYILSFSLDLIIINDEGVKKYHCGKLKKSIKWNEVVTSSIYPPNKYQGWIYISNYKVDYTFLSSSFMMFDKKSICMKYTPKIASELNKYLNDKLK